MSVVIETTKGDITVDLYLKDRPRACLNFLKLCKIKYFNYNLFHTISRGFIAQTGDPTGSRKGGESVYGVFQGPEMRYVEVEEKPRIKHSKMGLISFVGDSGGNEGKLLIGSQFFLTLGDDLTYLDGKHCVFGEVVEGFDVLELLNETICDKNDIPYQDVRITHTVVLDDPFPDPHFLVAPSRSPSPSPERLKGGRLAPDEEFDEMLPPEQLKEVTAEREAKARATILEMVGDIPDADVAPPENVLFVCKLNPVTSDDDLEIIFSRFGRIKSCEVIRDRKTGDSLQYAFVEFEERKSCEDAYFKMDNVLIDDRRIHVDFSQSVSKVRWLGKGRMVRYSENDKGEVDKDLGGGKYKKKTDIRQPERDRNKDKYRNYRYGREGQEKKNDERKEYDRKSSQMSRRDSNDRNNRREVAEKRRRRRSKSRSRSRDGKERKEKSRRRERRRRDSSSSEERSRKRYNEDKEKRFKSKKKKNRSRRSSSSSSN